MREEQRKKQEGAARLAKIKKENSTVIDADAGGHSGNETEQLILLNLTNSSSCSSGYIFYSPPSIRPRRISLNDGERLYCYQGWHPFAVGGN